MTKRDAALDLLGLARSIHRESGGDDEADVWITRLLWIAFRLDPRIVEHRVYGEIVTGGGDSRGAKLRRLIEHPSTPAGEREAAVAALARIRSADRVEVP